MLPRLGITLLIALAGAGCAQQPEVRAHGRDGEAALARAPTRPVVQNLPVAAATCASQRGLAAAPFPREPGVYRAGPLTIVFGDDLAQHPASGGEAIVVLTRDTPTVLRVDPSSRVRAALYFTSPRDPRLPPTIDNGQPAVRFPGCGRRVHRFGGGIVFAGRGCARLSVQPADRPPRALLVPVGDSLQGCPPARGALNLDPAAVFVQDPYMGVSCPMSNSIACDRVGLSVWLAHPATVTATIAGSPLRLDDPNWSYVAHQDGTPMYVYAGFLQPAGITARLHVVPIGQSTWLGAYAPTPLVRFQIDYGHGKVVNTQEHVLLHAGWG